MWEAASGEFAVRTWEGQMVVYDPRSGDTHCLDELASAVLTTLRELGRGSLPDIGQRITAARPGSSQIAMELSAALTELAALQLIRRLP